MNESIKVSIEIQDAAAKKILGDIGVKSEDVDKKLKKLGKSGSDAFDQVSVSIGKSLGVYDIFAGNLAANLVTKGFEIMSQAAGTLFNTLVVDGIAAAQESEEALNDFNRALEKSGISASDTKKEFDEFVKGIQATTTFEDDLVRKNMALIQSLAQLDKDGLKGATQAALDLSAALGKDLETASTAVAKAANGNYTAINKMGVEFEKTGSKSQTFANALAAIEEKFGGAAVSKVNTFAGSIEQAKNFFGDLQEEIGGFIISNPAVIAMISSLANSIKSMTEGFDSGTESSMKLANSLLVIIRTVEITVRVFDGLLTAVLTVWDSIVVATSVALLAIVKPFTFFSETAQTVFETLEEQIVQTSDQIGERLGNGGVLTGVIDTLDQMGDAAESSMSKIGVESAKAAAGTGVLTAATKKLTEEQERQREETNKYVENLAKKATSIEENQKLELESLKLMNEQKALLDEEGERVNYEAKLARQNEFFTASQARIDSAFSAEQAQIASSSLNANIKADALLAAEKRYTLESLKIQTDHKKQSASVEKERSKLQIEDRKSTFSTIATLASSNNDTLASIGKAAGIAQIAIDTPVAITKALAAFPPPFNFAAAGAVAAAAAVQAAKIAGLNFEQGGIVPGTSFTGDRIQANVNSGEMILNKNQQAELFKVANGQGGSGNGDLVSELRNLRQEVVRLASQPVSIQIDGREIINVTRNQLASGRTI